MQAVSCHADSCTFTTQSKSRKTEILGIFRFYLVSRAEREEKVSEETVSRALFHSDGE